MKDILRKIKFMIRFPVPKDKLQQALILYPGKSEKEVGEKVSFALTVCLIFSLLVSVVIFVFIGLFFRETKSNNTGIAIEREDVNGGAKAEKIILSDGVNKYEYSLRINPVLMSEEEIDSMETEIEKILDKCLAGMNDSLEKVETDLIMPPAIEGFPVSVNWSTSDVNVIDSSGKVENSYLTEPKNIIVSAIVTYGEEFRLYEKTVTVYPKVRDESEQKAFDIFCKLQEKEKNSVAEKNLVIPDYVEGLSVYTSGEEKISVIQVGIMTMIFILIMTYMLFFGSIEKKSDRRIRKAEKDYRQFVSELSLMLSAGLTVRKSLKHMVDDKAFGGEGNLLYENLVITVSEIKNGESEISCYERFGIRMGAVKYKRISSVLCQSVSKGVKHVTEVLEREAEEAVAESREIIKVRAEKAGTKLLVPIMGFLIIVFCILMVPAFKLF